MTAPINIKQVKVIYEDGTELILSDTKKLGQAVAKLIEEGKNAQWRVKEKKSFFEWFKDKFYG